MFSRWPSSSSRCQDSRELVVDLGDHRVVAGLDVPCIMFLGSPYFVLKIERGEFLADAPDRMDESGGRASSRRQTDLRRLGGDERWMRIVNVDVQQPRLIAAGPIGDELDRPLGSPGGLVQFGRHAVARSYGAHRGLRRARVPNRHSHGPAANRRAVHD